MDYKYNPESDVLAITISKTPFDHAQEMGDFIVHFSKKDKPVYVEILNAHRFLTDVTMKLPKSSQKELFHHVQTA